MGTAAVNNGSTSVTLSTTQSSGQQYQYCYFSGDTSGGLYEITSQSSGTAQTISPAFGGSNLSAAICVTAPATSIIVYPAPGDTTGMLAMGQAVVNSSGVITAVNVLSGGTGYTLPPLVSMPAPLNGGTTASVTTTISGGFVTGFTVVSGGTGYGGSTADGHPIAINSNKNVLNVSTSGVPSATPVADAAIGDGEPDMTGVWTFVADESSPSTPMVVSFYALQRQHARRPIRDVHADHYPRDDREWCRDRQDVAVDRDPRQSEPESAQPQHSDGRSGFRRSRRLDPVQRIPHGSRTVQPHSQSGGHAQPGSPLAPDQNLTNWLTVSGNVSRATYRHFGTLGNGNWYNNVVDASDLRPSTDFAWGDGPRRSNYFTVTAIRAYIISSAGSPAYNSPYVFAWSNYPGTTSSAAIPGTRVLITGYRREIPRPILSSGSPTISPGSTISPRNA